MRMTGKQEATLEFIEFQRRVQETGIAHHLSNQAITLMFISLGPDMWRDHGQQETSGAKGRG